MPSGIYYIIRIAIDPIFPPPELTKWTGGKKEFVPENTL
jgi:hypothetical protein